MSNSPIAFNISFNGYTNFTASVPSQRVQVLNTTNPLYLRYAVLSGDNLQVVYYSASAVIPMASIYQAMFTALSSLTYAPFIGLQPTSSTATHPSSLYFVVSSSSEIPTTYQWLWQSSSLSTYVNCPTTYFSGTASAALTCSSTVVNIENSASYFCVASNASGQASSSIVQSYIL
jgi:hypothetical protein